MPYPQEILVLETGESTVGLGVTCLLHSLQCPLEVAPGARNPVAVQQLRGSLQIEPMARVSLQVNRRQAEQNLLQG